MRERRRREGISVVTAGSHSTVLEYDALRDSLTHAGAVLTLPELHGGICGALCAGGPQAAESWLDDALADDFFAAHATHDIRSLRESLSDLVRGTWQTLAGTELAFEPLLPDDDTALDEQVQALAAWCQGFLAGLGESAPDAAQRERGERIASIDEILADFAEISRAGLTDEDTADRDRADFALTELKEYARVSTQLVFEELASRRAGASRETH
jgi:uncharacterized protein YgfB (UPF0149 family)